MSAGLRFYAQLQTCHKLFVLIFRRQWDSRHPQGFGRGRSPKGVRRHIATHHRTSPDHRPFTDSHIGQDDAVRPNKDVLFDHNFSVVRGSSGSRVKVGNYRCSEADCAVISDRYVRGMYFINVYKLANPHVTSDHNSAQPVQPRSQTESSRGHKSDPTREPTEQNWEPQRPLPPVVSEMLKTGRVIERATSSDHLRPVFAGRLTGCRSPSLDIITNRRHG